MYTRRLDGTRTMYHIHTRVFRSCMSRIEDTLAYRPTQRDSYQRRADHTLSSGAWMCVCVRARAFKCPLPRCKTITRVHCRPLALFQIAFINDFIIDLTNCTDRWMRLNYVICPSCKTNAGETRHIAARTFARVCKQSRGPKCCIAIILGF